MPELIDGSMLSPGVVVVDVSANRVPVDAGGTGETGESGEPGGSEVGDPTGPDRASTVVGDGEYDSASAVAAAITPVPGGVGPVTLASLAENVVPAAERHAGRDP